MDTRAQTKTVSSAARYSIRILARVALILVFVGSGASSRADDKSDPAANPITLLKVPAKKWTVLHDSRKIPPDQKQIPKKSPLVPLDDFAFTGPRPGDPFLLGNFRSRGEWGLVEGNLSRTGGRNAAIGIARAEEFELEGQFNVEGLGGWFLIFGWDQQHGYMLYNVNLKTSGSPWLVTEFRGAKGIEETHREVYRYEWRGFETLRVTVENGMLNAEAAGELIARQVPLPNYHEGDIILGTYDTRYGPKPIAVRSLRIRGL